MGKTGAIITLMGATALVVGGLTMLQLSKPEGDAEFYRQAETIATAVSWPRQHSAAGFTRAVLATNAGKSGGVRVVESTELDAESPQDPMARLVLRFHRDAVQGKFASSEAVTACYELMFNYYGAVGSPAAVDCPRRSPITTQPAPVLGEPPFDEALTRVLDELPDPPTQQEVTSRVLLADLYRPKPMTEDVPQLDPQDPILDVVVDGKDVGVAFYRAAPGICVLGSTVDGTTAVWHPAAAEQTDCTGKAAVAGTGR